MKHALPLAAIWCALVVPIFGQPKSSSADQAKLGTEAFAVPTFHCVSVYWSPAGGAADKEVLVRYRAMGKSAWQDALPMRYNPIPNTDEDLTDYRGSIVHLSPATT